MKLNRRDFLSRASAAGLLGTGGLTGGLMSMPALAADTTGYKALVCVFMFGGMDHYDTVLPYDQTSYDSFATTRESLFAQYVSANSPRGRADLLALNPSNAGTLAGRQFALPQELAPLHAMFEAGDAAILANVGPLLEPTDREMVLNGQARLPRQLFSHNDQQSTWMSSAPEGALFGWGGRFADAALQSNANQNALFTGMSTFGNQVWLSGDIAQQYQLSIGGPDNLIAIQWPPYFGAEGQGVSEMMERHFRSQGQNPSNLFQRDITDRSRRALDANEAYSNAREEVAEISTTFPGGFFAQQLRTVAEAISLRNVLGASRQVFFVGIGGFDTHSAQARDLINRQSQLAAGLAAFQTAMSEIGARDEVTVFTASDFGRTLSINGDGTDHGWGSHHFIIGGAVNGRQIYGDMPEYGFEHTQDAGNGRLIPTTSVEQYAATLGRWFGLDEQELAIALPGLSNFPSSPAFV